MESPSLVVAIPAYNEAETVANVIASVRRAEPDCAIVVVDDGSRDRTAAIAARAGATVLQLPFNLGVGGALRTAFVYARDTGATAFVQVDADGQHDPAQIGALVGALDGADVVVGSRFGSDDEFEASRTRRFAMRIIASIVSWATRTRIDDATSGFRAAGPRAIALFATELPAEYLGDTVESLVIASRNHLTITQVPVTMMQRQGGSASQNSFRSVVYVGRAILAVLVALAHPREKQASG